MRVPSPLCVVSHPPPFSFSTPGLKVGHVPQKKALHLSVLQLHIQEVKVPEHPELLLGAGVLHVVGVPGAVRGGDQAGLQLHQVQLPTAGEDHLGHRHRQQGQQDMVTSTGRWW